MVEMDGIEPTASCLQGRCSPNVSYTPKCLLYFPQREHPRIRDPPAVINWLRRVESNHRHEAYETSALTPELRRINLLKNRNPRATGHEGFEKLYVPGSTCPLRP